MVFSLSPDPEGESKKDIPGGGDIQKILFGIIVLDWGKGRKYTVQQVKSDWVLLKEIM